MLQTSTRNTPDAEQHSGDKSGPAHDPDKQKDLNHELEKLKAEQRLYEQETVEPSKSLANGAAANLKSSEEELKRASSWLSPTGLFSRFGGTTEALRGQVAAEQKLLAEREIDVKAHSEALKKSQKLAKEAEDFAVMGKYDEAREKIEQSRLAMNVDSTTDTKSYAKSLRDSGQKLAASENKLEKTETVARTVRNGAVVIVATGGVGAAATLGAGVAGSAGIGFLAGVGAGSASNAAEQIGHVGIGNKTADEALGDAGRQFVQDIRTSAVSAGSAAVAGPIAGKIMKSAGGVAATTIRGGLTGGTQGLVSTGLDTGLAIASGEEVTLGTVAHNGTKSFIAGFAGGVIGSGGSLARAGGAGKGLVTSAEGAADAAAGVAIEAGDAAIQGRDFSLSDAFGAAAQSAQGTIMGHVQNVRSSPRSQKITVNGTEGAVRVSSDGKVIYADSPELVREMFYEKRRHELSRSGELSQSEIDRRARLSSEGVAAFYDSDTGTMVVPNPSGKSREERIIAGSLIRHESKHAEGATEAECWTAQAKYLQKNGYHLDFSSGEPQIVKLTDGEIRPIEQDGIQDFVETKYAGDTNYQTAAARFQRKDGKFQIDNPSEAILPPNQQHIDENGNLKWDSYKDEFLQRGIATSNKAQREKFEQIISNNNASDILRPGVPVAMPKGNKITVITPQEKNYGADGAMEVQLRWKGEELASAGQPIEYMVRYHTNQSRVDNPPSFIVHRNIPQRRGAPTEQILMQDSPATRNLAENHPDWVSRDASGNIWLNESVRNSAIANVQGRGTEGGITPTPQETRAILDGTHFHWVPQKWYK